MAKMPATRSPYPAGIANAAGREGETTSGTKKLSPMNRGSIWGVTNRASAVLFHDPQTRPDVELSCDAGTHKTHQHTDSEDRKSIDQFPPGSFGD
jgi:hypothetical protein